MTLADRILSTAVSLEDKDQDDQADMLIIWAYENGLIAESALIWWLT